MSAELQPIYCFADFKIDTRTGVLRNGSGEVALRPKSLDLLVFLVRNAGRVVSKDDLLSSVWNDVVVTEDSLTQCVSDIRRALGDKEQKLIRTLPRRGYMFAGEVLLAAVVERPAAVDKPSLVVLPFDNMSSDREQSFFADGVVEEITTALSRFRSFSVIARNSAFVYKGRSVDVRQVAEELGVRYVLEGSVRRVSDRLRIATQLVDGLSGAHLWAQIFEGSLNEVFDFEDRITESVATLVAPHIQAAEIERSRRERPGSMAAYDCYLSALSKIRAETPSENAAAYALLADALLLEPDNALLLAHAAWVLEHRITMGWPALGANDRADCFQLARRGLEKAAGDPTVMAHCAMALVQVAREYDWGMAVLTAALDANPNNLEVVTAAGIAHLHCGSVTDAVALFDRAGRLSPRDPFAHIALCGQAHAQMILGNYETALAWAARSLAVNPNFDATYWILIAANARLGRMEDARRYLGKLKAIAPDVTIAGIRAGLPAKDPGRMTAILDGLRLAGLPED
ncbi:winged helix-turn-helix domain-containing protein [Mesorhizobium opportunistum]|uniref:Winged helix-turn-helix domain-containing protein n=1 Tax=Mesorhizobium opportunistum TaxID=593909 RepID=A0ABV1YBH9_9HYPH|nr:winged helix-turn-helix domain-containing protein [Mesorhizobium sp.]TIN90726.1 MAG: transcriptional regulator [Mesorhizobium sp.]TJU97906.1 MAG: transcriptional regulator [Mesorhizobium sp.]TJV16273.1 MAG: transcriptional regulator [Mesorhizobium sp.]